MTEYDPICPILVGSGEPCGKPATTWSIFTQLTSAFPLCDFHQSLYDHHSTRIALNRSEYEIWLVMQS